MSHQLKRWTAKLLMETLHSTCSSKPKWLSPPISKITNTPIPGKLYKTILPISVTGVPYSKAEIAVHFPVPFCPALSLILGSRWVPSSSLNFRILAVISMRKESSSVLFHWSKAWSSNQTKKFSLKRKQTKTVLHKEQGEAYFKIQIRKEETENGQYRGDLKNYNIMDCSCTLQNNSNSRSKLVSNLSHFIMIHTQHILHQMVGLADQLHVTVFNTVMDHLNKMSSSFISNLNKHTKHLEKCIHSLYKCIHIYRELILTQSQHGCVPTLAAMLWKIPFMCGLKE